MEHVRENQLELVVSSCDTTSLEELLHAQKDLFRSQIDELENVVLTQCKLTGVNPLSQEMAAGALSIKIGKRPRDLLNPKALKYMQCIFSIKDVISKKETREISALFGVTATQVREFFTSQRSRVRKFVRLARDKANRSSSGKEMLELHDGIPPMCDPNEPLDPVPLDSVAPISAEEGPTCSKQDEVLPPVDESDKHFVENIFSLMRKEETFSGQVKLMEWILQIQNSSVLYWFLTKGGIMILATWLSQAVVEEQTSVLHVILKVLCHLPLQKALPVHMSAVLQSVNRLRFYRASDISNRARILLSKWSKAFARSQALKDKKGTKSASDSQDEMLLKQSISEVMGNGSWDGRIDAIEDVSAPLDESSGSVRKLESQPLKLLTASTDDTNKKPISGGRSSQSRERRKVLLVEQPCQKSTGRSSQVGRATAATKGRPLSADDIQKAKMRAQFMQSKYGKTNTTSNESSLLQLEAANKSNSPQISILQPAPKAHIGCIIEEPKKSEIPPLTESNLQDASVDNKMASDAEEPPQKKCKRVQIPWQTPPEIALSVSWRVGAGENSKEVEVQKKRIHREREIVYKVKQEIPSDPREPWDLEIDYDDTLTPEIPIEQLPDAEGAEASLCPRENEGTTNASTSLSQNAGGSVPEPDMELLAVLLKNPELVFALTSGQANNLSNNETVKLLDMIKANSSSSSSLSVLGGNRNTEEKVEVSLPSPTPSSNVTNGWKADLAKNPFSRQMMNNNEMQGVPGIATAAAIRSQQSIQASSLVHPHIQPTRSTLVAEQSAPVLHLSQQSLTAAVRSQAATQPQILNLPTTVVLSQQSGTVVAQTGQQLSLQQLALGPHEQQRLVTVASLSQPGAYAYASQLKTNTIRSNLLNTPAMQVETARMVNPSALPNVVGTSTRPVGSWANTQMQPSYAPELPASHSWRPSQAMDQIPYHQSNMNLNNYNSLSRGFVRAPMQPGSWERNELADEPDFESWSPENSPTRSHRYNNSHGWNFPQSRVNPGHSYRSERPISRNPGYPSPSGYRDPGKSGNKRWNDRSR